MIDKVEEKVCEYFKLDVNGLLCRSKKNALARGYLWYILHYDLCLSVNTIAKRYERAKRVVNTLIAKTKYLVEHQKVYKEHYEKIKSI